MRSLHWFVKCPLSGFLVACGLCLALLHRRRTLAPATLLRGAFWAACVCPTLVVVATILSGFQPGVVRGVAGPNIIAIAAGFPHGLPLYHSTDGHLMYNLIYGPYTYLLYTPVVHLFPHSLALRLYVALICLASFVILHFILRRYASAAIALVLLSIPTGFLIATQWTALDMNADIWIFFFACLGLLCADSPSHTAPVLSGGTQSDAIRPTHWLPPLFVGISAGVLVDLKVSLLPLACLLFLRQLKRRGVRPAVLSIAIAIAVAGLPFFSPGISLANYLAWLALSGHRVIDPDLANIAVFCALLFYAPPLLLLAARPPQAERPADLDRRRRLLSRLYAATLLAATLLTWYAASQAGGGSWHFWPLLPFLAVLTAEMTAEMTAPHDPEPPLNPPSSLSALGHAAPPRLSAQTFHPHAARMLTALCLGSLVIALRYTPRSFHALLRESSAGRAHKRQAEQELDTLARQPQSQPLAMAPAIVYDDPDLDLRFKLAPRPGTYVMDPIAMQAAEAFRPTLPDISPGILSCDVHWVVPHNGIPFSTHNDSSNQPYLFSDRIRLGFPQTHHRLEAGAVYDVWGCE